MPLLRGNDFCDSVSLLLTGLLQRAKGGCHVRGGGGGGDCRPDSAPTTAAASLALGVATSALTSLSDVWRWARLLTVGWVKRGPRCGGRVVGRSLRVMGVDAAAPWVALVVRGV